MDKSHLKDELKKTAYSWGNAVSNGNYRTANKMYGVLVKTIKLLGKDKNLAESILTSLLEYSAIPVRYWASVGLLMLGIEVEQGEVVLSKIANDLDTGPVGAMAKISLLEWKKKNASSKQKDEPAE